MPNYPEGLTSLFQRHVGSYRLIPYPVELQHKRRFLEWASDLAAWSSSTGESVVISSRLLGDPHQPDGSRPALLRIGRARRKLVWKPGLDRFQIETTFQEIVEVLGKCSGLAPVRGVKMAGGGAWAYVKRGGNRKPSNNDVGRAFAHLLILSASLGISDLHFENIHWDGRFFRLIDIETFCGPTLDAIKERGPQTKRQRIAARISKSSLLLTLLHRFNGLESAQSVSEHLESALSSIQEHWGSIFKLRSSLCGKYARVLVAQSLQLSRLMPFAMSSRFREKARSEFFKHTPDGLPKDEMFEDLINGCIPIFRLPIPAIEDEVDGVIEPDKVMVQVIRAILRGIELRTDAQQSDLSRILKSVRVEDASALHEGPEFYALPNNGNDPGIFWNHPGFCFGLGGISFLHRVEDFLGRTHSMECSHEVADTESSRIKNSQPYAGAYMGLAGEMMLGWGLFRIGALEDPLLKVLDERLGYLRKAKGPPIIQGQPYPSFDLGFGQPGSLLGLVRAAEFLTRRESEIRNWAKEMTEEIEDEVRHLLSHQDRLQSVDMGFAHGLAGTAFALRSARDAFGFEVETLNPIIGLLQNRLTGHRRSYGPFCSSFPGILAVLNSTRSHLTDFHDRTLRSTSGSSGCCGSAGFHLGRLSPIDPMENRTPSCQGCSPFGYLGHAGYNVILLAQYGEIHDPLWGRRILPPLFT
jgi:hypothetical protein